MDRIIKMVIIAAMLLEVRFFYQILLPGGLNRYNYYNNKILICGVIMMGIGLMCIHILRVGYFNKRLFTFCVAGLLIIYILQVLNSSIIYDRGIGEIAKESYYYFLILFYFELSYCCRNKKGYTFFLRLIVILSCITSFLFLIQGIVYNANGKIFLKIFEILDQSDISLRGGKIRLTQPSTLCCFTIILSSAQIIKSLNDPSLRKHKFDMIINLSNVIFGIGYALIVAQTRMLTIGILSAIFIMFMSLKFNNQFKKVLFIMILLTAATIFLNTSAANDFFKSFTEKSNDGSMYARTEAYDYYMGKIMDNPIVPIGIISQISFPKGYAILHGPQGYLYPSDVGLLGLAVVMGVQALVWFALFILKLFKIIFKMHKHDKSNNYIELMGILAFLLITSSTLVVLDCERIMLVPFIMTVFEYRYKESFNKLEEANEGQVFNYVKLDNKKGGD